MFAFAVAILSLTADLSPAETARLAALQRDATVQCYGVAKGRKSVPIRENYLTFSDVVGEVGKGTFFLGQRVAGENKVLVLTPTAEGAIGIARHTFLAEVDAARCGGEALYAPPFDTLKGWGQPLAGGDRNPSVANADPVLHQGCYRAKQGASIQTPDGRTRLAPGTVLFAGDPLDGKGVSARLKALDPASGKTVGDVARSRLERVALAQCANL
jgi:hypothetical protein